MSDRLIKTRKWFIVISLIFLIAITFAFSTIPPGTALALLAILFFGFGLFTGGGNLIYPHIKELMPQDMAGAAMTGINFFTMIGPAVFLQGLGSMMQTLYPHASRIPQTESETKQSDLKCQVTKVI
jgi:MFS family permease